MERLFIAYGLIALLIGAAIGLLVYVRHSSPLRTYHRRMTREKADHQRRMARKMAK